MKPWWESDWFSEWLRLARNEPPRIMFFKSDLCFVHLPDTSTKLIPIIYKRQSKIYTAEV